MAISRWLEKCWPVQSPIPEICQVLGASLGCWTVVQVVRQLGPLVIKCGGRMEICQVLRASLVFWTVARVVCQSDRQVIRHGGLTESYQVLCARVGSWIVAQVAFNLGPLDSRHVHGGCM